MSHKRLGVQSITVAASLSLLGTALLSVPAVAAPLDQTNDSELAAVLTDVSHEAAQAKAQGELSDDSDQAQSTADDQPQSAEARAASSNTDPAASNEADPDAPAAGGLASLDFDGIIPDDANFRVPNSAQRFAQSDGTYLIPRPTAGGPGAGTQVSGLEEFYNQKIEWGSCADFDPAQGDAYDNPTAQCGYLIVPLDYSNPTGETIAIGLYKVPATDQANKIGTLFVDPGGPGGSGMGTANGFASSGTGVVRERFDYIGFDPRGVGSSLPMVRCQSSDAFDKQRQDNDWYTSEQYASVSEYNTQQCLSNTGSQFNISGEKFIANVGTVNVIRDLDIARAAVGDPKINYLGYSYGTSIGYHYAKAFPDNIRTMIIDGVVNPFENNAEAAAEFEKYTASTSAALDSELSQMQGFQSTFEQFLKTCAENDGFSMRGRKYPCATGTNVDNALAEYQKIARSTFQNNSIVAADGRILSFYDMSQATILSMYSESLWPYLNKALLDLRDKQDPNMAQFLSDYYYDRSDEGTYDYGTMAAFPSIWCTDYGTTPGANEGDGPVERKKALYAVAPFMDPGTNPDGTPRGLRAEVDWCTFYKNSHTLPKGEALVAMPNILVISTSYDPSTPYQDGVVAAAALRGTLLSVAGNDHTAYRPGNGSCTAQITEKYLVDLTVPTDITGEQGVETKDLESNVITGNECRVDSFRPTPAIKPVVTNQGFTVDMEANGLVRNTTYTITLPAELGGGVLNVTSNEAGEVSFSVPVGEAVAPGTYMVELAPADLSLNDPTVRATGEIKVVPFLVEEFVEKVLDQNLTIELPIAKLPETPQAPKAKAIVNPKSGALASTGASDTNALMSALVLSGLMGTALIALRRRK